jgi:hypothetical protein
MLLLLQCRLQVVRQCLIAVTRWVNRVISPHYCKGFSYVRAGASGAVQSHAQLCGVDHGDVPDARDEQGILDDAAQGVEPREESILVLGLVQVGHVVGLRAAARVPVAREGGQDQLLSLGVDAE